MRYQYPASSAFGHYWDEETAKIWGIGNGISGKVGYYLDYLLGEVVFAHLFLLVRLTASQRIVLSLARFLTRAKARVNVGEIMKRGTDVAGASLGLMLTLPFWLLIAIAVKLDSRGPVFYRQERVGQNRRAGERRVVMLAGSERRSFQERRRQSGYGKSFMIIKFRSMRHNAESLTGPTWARKNDGRVTRVGRILRATRLDELPQLLNVIIGDMSLVGPRPERPCFACDLNGQIKDYHRRFEVKPGITGLAQVEHKYDECLEDVSKKVSYDLRYIRNWTIIKDIRIIMRTVVVVLTARGM
jgi:lipopolysaccharide/colanic/teichoic acid biosynthesis glycosyltransferase